MRELEVAECVGRCHSLLTITASRSTRILSMAYPPPTSTIKTDGKRRAPYQRPRGQDDSGGPSREQGSPVNVKNTSLLHFVLSGYRTHHLQEFRVGSSRNHPVSLVMKCASIASNLIFRRRAALPRKSVVPPPYPLQYTNPRVEPFLSSHIPSVNLAVRMAHG